MKTLKDSNMMVGVKEIGQKEVGENLEVFYFVDEKT